jgi:hypothetical protein
LTQPEEYFEASPPLWEPAPLAVAEDYLRRARRGLMTPEAIEAELAAKGFLPLSVTPSRERFDPGAEVWWTLAMTAAWIIWRTPDAVRQAWWSYRREVRLWVGPQEFFVECESQPSEWGYRQMEKAIGYSLEPLRELDLFGVLLRSTLEQRSGAAIVGEAARQSLWRRLENGELVAEALRSGGSDRGPIRDADWIDLDHYRQVGWPVDSVGRQYEKMPRFLAVRVRSFRVIELWPAQAPEAGEGVPKDPTRPRHERREAIRQAYAALWPDGLPIGFMVKRRDAMIQERLKADGLLPPASRTIARALDGSKQGRM